MHLKSSPTVPLLVVALALAGCQALPQAGLIYSSTQTVGVGLKVSGADAAAPVDISIGVKLADIAYVPVVTGAVDGSSPKLIHGSHGNSSGDVKQCLDSVKGVNESIRTLATASRSVDPNLCDVKLDALSVYGQFNGNSTASATDKSAGVLVGKIFATGVAAQHITEASSMVAMADCIKAAAGSETDAAKRQVLIEKFCSRSSK